MGCIVLLKTRLQTAFTKLWTTYMKAITKTWSIYKQHGLGQDIKQHVPTCEDDRNTSHYQLYCAEMFCPIKCIIFLNNFQSLQVIVTSNVS